MCLSQKMAQFNKRNCYATCWIPYGISFLLIIDFDLDIIDNDIWITASRIANRLIVHCPQGVGHSIFLALSQKMAQFNCYATSWIPYVISFLIRIMGGGALVFQAGYHPCKRTFKTQPKHVFSSYENRP